MKQQLLRTAAAVCLSIALFVLFSCLPGTGGGLAASACALLGLLIGCLQLLPMFRRRRTFRELLRLWMLLVLLPLCLRLSPPATGLTVLGWAAFVYGLYRFSVSIQDAACTDPLTELPNKVRWDQLMDRRPEDDCILMLDLNRLKKINDTLGHATGDKVLVRFTQILQESLPSGSMICRWGGDEFAVLLRGADAETVEGCLSAIRDAAVNYTKPAIHFAAGFALSQEHPDLTRRQLLELADRRMYQDKRQWYAENPE